MWRQIKSTCTQRHSIDLVSICAWSDVWPLSMCVYIYQHHLSGMLCGILFKCCVDRLVWHEKELNRLWVSNAKGTKAMRVPTLVLELINGMLREIINYCLKLTWCHFDLFHECTSYCGQIHWHITMAIYFHHEWGTGKSWSHKMFKTNDLENCVSKANLFPSAKIGIYYGISLSLIDHGMKTLPQRDHNEIGHIDE